MTKAIYVAPDPPPRHEPRSAATATTARPEMIQPQLRGLVARGVLTAEQADAVQRELRLPAPEPARPGPRVPWAEIAGYLGGGLVLTGAVVLVATSWEQLTENARSGLLAGFTTVLLLAAVAAAGGLTGLATARQRTPTARLRVAGALLALTAGGAAFTVGVALPDDAGSTGVAIAAGTGLLISAAAYALLPTAFGLIAAGVLGLATVMATLESTIGTSPLDVGLTLYTCGALLAGLALWGVFRHRLLALGMGTAVAMLGAQQPLGQDGAAPLAYLLTLTLAAACLVAYRWQRTWVLLVGGVIGVTLAVPEAVWDLTNGAVGGAAILLVAGSILLAASGIGFRIYRRPTKE